MFVSAHACFCVFIVVCTCVWRVVWGPDVRDHQMRALAKVYTSTTPECQAGGSSVLRCPFCIPRTYYFTLVHPVFFVLWLWWGWRQCRQWYIMWRSVPACVFWVVMMTDGDFGDVYDADGDENDDVVDISREGLCVRIPNLSRNIAPSTFCFLTPMTVMCKSISQQRFPSELCITS